MSVTSVDTDPDGLSVTLIADFDAPVERVWELWSNPRQLERWWGPPDYPATFEDYELLAGAEVKYFMTGPDEERHGGLWRITAVNPPASLDFVSYFADPDGTPIEDMPATEVTVRLTQRDAGTRMHIHTTFESREDLEKWLSTGTREGQQRAVAQMDALLH